MSSSIETRPPGEPNFAVPPSAYGSISKGGTYDFDLTITAPRDVQQVGTYDGIIELRSGSGSKTYAKPLPVELDIVWPAFFEVTDTSDVGHNLIGAASIDSNSNEIIAYIPDVFDFSDIQITTGIDHGPLLDRFQFITDKFVRVVYPSGFEGTRVALRIKYSERPNRVIEFDETRAMFGSLPFDDSEEGVINLRVTLDGRSTSFALVFEN